MSVSHKGLNANVALTKLDIVVLQVFFYFIILLFCNEFIVVSVGSCDFSSSAHVILFLYLGFANP